MCTEAMYEEMMRQQYGEWAEFFMNSNMEFDMPPMDTALTEQSHFILLEAA